MGACPPDCQPPCGIILSFAGQCRFPGRESGTEPPVAPGIPTGRGAGNGFGDPVMPPTGRGDGSDGGDGVVGGVGLPPPVGLPKATLSVGLPAAFQSPVSELTKYFPLW